MHAERLNSIVSEAVDSFEREGILAHLNTLIADVNERLSNPAERSFDENISRDTKVLFAALDRLSIGQFPPTWRKIMRELHMEILAPDVIRAEVEQAFASRLVDSDFAKALVSLRERVGMRLEKITTLRNAFRSADIGTDELAAGEVAFDVAMPRESINDSLATRARSGHRRATPVRSNAANSALA